MQDYLDFLRAAVLGGVDMVQWREKSEPYKKIYQAEAIKKLLDEWQVPLMINDYPDICKQVGAGGVHLGNSDMAVAMARPIIGGDKIIGVSIESEDDLKQANQDAAIDYMTASAVYPSVHKSDTQKIWGIEELKKLVKMAQKPLTAIGGITLDNLADVMATGVAGVAVVGAIHNRQDPYNTAKKMREIIDHYARKTAAGTPKA